MKCNLILLIFIHTIIVTKALGNKDNSLISIETEDCGTKKNCFISPEECDSKNAVCNFVLKWDYDGHYINYDLKAVVKGWITVLFSDDKKLGNDNIVVCKSDEQAYSNNIIISHYYLDLMGEYPDLIKLPISRLSDGDGLYNKAGYFKDGLIHCKFSRTKTSGVELVNNLNTGHHVFVSQGATGDLIISNLMRSFKPNDKAIEFYTEIKEHTKSNWLVKFHAIIMIIAWILLSSLGIIIARYYKPLWPNPNHDLFNLRVWFSFHRSIMLTVLVLTLLSFLLILIHMRFTWSKDGMELTHSILGIIVICLVVINPLLGFIRPQPDTYSRCVFFWFHWLIGTIAYCLSVLAIFIGMDLRKLDLPNWCSWILFFWVIFHIIVEIILEVHYCCTFHKHNEKYTEYSPINNSNSNNCANPPGYRWKPSLLFIYVAVTIVVVLLLVVLILIKDLF